MRCCCVSVCVCMGVLVQVQSMQVPPLHQLDAVSLSRTHPLLTLPVCVQDKKGGKGKQIMALAIRAVCGIEVCTEAAFAQAFCFQAVFTEGLVYMAAKGAEERDEWIAKIREGRHACREHGVCWLSLILLLCFCRVPLAQRWPHAWHVPFRCLSQKLVDVLPEEGS